MYGKSAEEHDENVRKTLEIVKASGLKLNKVKCEFKKDRLTYFRHILSADKVSPDPKKVKSIRQLEAPNNVPKLRRVMGMINHLGRFILNLATEMNPMSDLLKSDSVWTWGPPQKKAFDKVKG